MRKLNINTQIFLAVLACAAFLFPCISFANDWTEFGGSQERQRFSQELTAPPVIPKWMLDTGASRSQPILIGDRIYHLAGKRLWVLDARAPYDAKESQLVIDRVLVSEEPTASHPTWTGKGVYFGTGKHPDGQYRLGYYDPSRPGQYVNVPLPAQIVSAPLVLVNDTVVVATTDGNVHVVRGLSSGEYKHAPFKIGNGRVSSSPAPLGPDSFIIGLDAGNSVKSYKIITGADGNISLQRIWYLQTETGVPASFAVKGDALYFSDKGGAFYCVDKNTGRIIWRNTDLFSANQGASFINNSPAVSNTNVYFTMRRKDGSGLLVGLNKDTGQIVLQSRLEGEGNTAPVVWRSAGAVLVADTAGNVYAFAGADGKPFLWTWGWDSQGNPALGSVINLSDKLYRAPSDWDQLSGAGVELTLASGTMGNEGTLFLAGVNTAETEGYLCAWGTSPLGNVKAVSIDPGVPAGEKAKPGQKYTARVIFKNEYPLDLPDIPVGGYHNQWPATLKDETGQELPKKVIGGKLTYVADFNAGETRTFTFDWHAPEDRAATTLYGNVNNDKTGINWPETNYGDNEVSVKVPVDLPTDLSVQILEYPKEVHAGNPVTVKAKIRNSLGTLIKTRLVWKVNGNIVKDVPNFDLISEYDDAITFNMCKSCDNAVVTVEVNPDRNAPPDEPNWDNNLDTCTVAKLPEYNPEDQYNLKIRIEAPDRVDYWKNFNFRVVVDTYVPPPPPLTPCSPPTVRVVTDTSGGYITTKYSYTDGSMDNVERPVHEEESFSAPCVGWSTHAFTYTQPGLGITLNEHDVIIEAVATMKGKTARAIKRVRVAAVPVDPYELQLTR